MTDALLVLGTNCALCKKKFKGDEGVGIQHRGKILWMHTPCSRKFKARLKRKRDRNGSRKESRRKSRRSG